MPTRRSYGALAHGNDVVRTSFLASRAMSWTSFLASRAKRINIKQYNLSLCQTMAVLTGEPAHRPHIQSLSRDRPHVTVLT